MIRIDNRLFVPFAVGIDVVIFFRLMAWIAGVQWDEELGAISVVIGAILAFALTIVLFAGEINLGHTTIGRRKE